MPSASSLVRAALLDRFLFSLRPCPGPRHRAFGAERSSEPYRPWLDLEWPAEKTAEERRADGWAVS